MFFYVGGEKFGSMYVDFKNMTPPTIPYPLYSTEKNHTRKLILPARWLFEIPADWGSFLLSVFLPNWEGRRKGGGEGLVIAITVTVLLTSPKSFNISFKLQNKLSEIFPFWGWIISAFMLSPVEFLTPWVGRGRDRSKNAASWPSLVSCKH